MSITRLPHGEYFKIDRIEKIDFENNEYGQNFCLKVYLPTNSFDVWLTNYWNQRLDAEAVSRAAKVRPYFIAYKGLKSMGRFQRADIDIVPDVEEQHHQHALVIENAAEEHPEQQSTFESTQIPTALIPSVQKSSTLTQKIDAAQMPILQATSNILHSTVDSPKIDAVQMPPPQASSKLQMGKQPEDPVPGSSKVIVAPVASVAPQRANNEYVSDSSSSQGEGDVIVIDEEEGSSTTLKRSVKKKRSKKGDDGASPQKQPRSKANTAVTSSTNSTTAVNTQLLQLPSFESMFSQYS
ncbi:uncharacterized protein LOC129809023 [Phlebotomus papatasi]|uniref:uncharacterized protein LOC129809023 n=1 Tax=Phlebotomus papatasi TaxID=29031 RepID=UPI002483741B|nr:uncharacterized protein LOC129809023 [Phlebotomus papatasi]